MENFSVPIKVSRRHVHLSREVLDNLFGTGFQLSVRNPLTQIGQFASNETVKIVGPKGEFAKVRIVGPERNYTQFELTKTDADMLGINAPYSFGGNLDGAGVVKIIGPKGEVKIPCAVISLRHIHVSLGDAEKFQLQNKDIVQCEINTERAALLKKIVVRVDPNFVTEVHLDTDEGNAFSVNAETRGIILK